MVEIEKEIELLYSLWILAITRKEWFRDAREFRKELDNKRVVLSNSL